MSQIPSPVPLYAARALALHAQGLNTPNGAEKPPTLSEIAMMVERLGCVQIDTLHMVRRSHYLTLWSRLGNYDPDDFDRLIYDPAERRLFEYWMHAASIVPLSLYRHRLHEMERRRNGGGWWPEWSTQEENQAMVAEVRARVEAEGALRASDFEHNGPKRGSWWDWKPAKHALEHLYNVGDFMISDRVNFQRVYDLRERVLPDWVDTSLPTKVETDRVLVEAAVRALGLGAARHIADYTFMKRGEVAPVIADLCKSGVLVEVEAEQHDGATSSVLVHRKDLPLLERAADGDLIPARTTFLNPFDNLTWAKGRDEQFWGFQQRLEAYKPEKDRIWGYYCLPILHRDRLIGRFDPKLERKSGRLILRALYLEPGIDPAEELVADVAGAMRPFMEWHAATELVIERSTPAEFGKKLLAAM